MSDLVVRVALRRNGRVTQRDMAWEQARLVWLEPGFFKHPDIQGRADGGAFAPRHDGLLAIDADTRWVGELSHATSFSSFEFREVAQSMTLALRIAQTLGELEWQAQAKGSDPVAVAWTGQKSEDVWQAISRLAWDNETNTRARLAPVFPAPWQLQSFWAPRERDWLALATALVERQWIPSESDPLGGRSGQLQPTRPSVDPRHAPTLSRRSRRRSPGASAQRLRSTPFSPPVLTMPSHKPRSEVSTQTDAHGGQVSITLPALLPQEPRRDNVYGDLLDHLRLTEQWVAWLRLQLFVQDAVRFWPEELAGVRLVVSLRITGNELRAYGASVDTLSTTEDMDRFEGILEAFESNLAGNVDLENPDLVSYLNRMFPDADHTNGLEFVARDDLFSRAMASLPDHLAATVKAQALEQRLRITEPSLRGPRL